MSALKYANTHTHTLAHLHTHQVEAEVMRLKEENQGLREKLESQRVDLERCVCVASGFFGVCL